MTQTWTMITEQDVRVYAEIHYMEARFAGADHMSALMGVMSRLRTQAVKKGCYYPIPVTLGTSLRSVWESGLA